MLILVMPIVVQQAITTFVGLLDNIMVGSLGTTAISSVAIVNQLIFVFNITIFGVVSGASIFGAQFAGVKNYEGLKQTFRFKLLFGLLTAVAAIGVFTLYGESLLSLFLSNEGGSAAELAQTKEYGLQYLALMLLSLIPFMMNQAYAGTLREVGQTVQPMIAGSIAIVVNLGLNYLLIFGNFGFPELGVIGAAVGTVVSRYVELLYILVYTHCHRKKYPFVIGLYQSFYVSGNLMKKIFITGSPLILNEVAWSLGMTTINQSYSTRGLDVVAAININSTVWNLFCVLMFAMGTAVTIVVGQQLGAGNIEKAIDEDRKIITMSVILNSLMGALAIACSGLIPLLYNTSDEVRSLTSQLLIVAGFSLPLHAYLHVAYFTIRTGGKTWITFLFDSVYTWVFPVPLAFLLCRFTTLPMIWVYFAVQFVDVVKAIIGTYMLRSKVWAKNVIDKIETKS